MPGRIWGFLQPPPSSGAWLNHFREQKLDESSWLLKGLKKMDPDHLSKVFQRCLKARQASWHSLINEWTGSAATGNGYVLKPWGTARADFSCTSLAVDTKTTSPSGTFPQCMLSRHAPSHHPLGASLTISLRTGHSWGSIFPAFQRWKS
jgi:hypothetical protein